MQLRLVRKMKKKKGSKEERDFIGPRAIIRSESDYSPAWREHIREEVAGVVSKGKTKDPSKITQYGDINLPAIAPSKEVAEKFVKGSSEKKKKLFERKK